ncbi:hypothetical protein BROUX41_001849 [Berkeleyomyces rouxiae]|uniref:uncharacterized protein n=1 Tax=Berkeleyomyces rouxiae TaxID=2035830 RepID=UPI003B808276
MVQPQPPAAEATTAAPSTTLRRKTPSERTATQASLFILGASFSAASVLLTRRAVHRRRVAAVPFFFPAHARLAFPARLQGAIAQARAQATTEAERTAQLSVEHAASGAAEVKTQKAPGAGMTAWFPRFFGAAGEKSAEDAKVATAAVPREAEVASKTEPSAGRGAPEPSPRAPDAPAPTPCPALPPASLDPANPADLETMTYAAIALSLSSELARKRSDSAGLAAEALVLATANVVSFALLCAAGFAIALDIAEVEDVRAYARRSVLAAAGGAATPEEEERAEKELESMAREFLDKFGIAAEEEDRLEKAEAQPGTTA